jgi:hypothetical protein
VTWSDHRHSMLEERDERDRSKRKEREVRREGRVVCLNGHGCEIESLRRKFLLAR